VTDAVGGDAAPGFERIADEFRRNFSERGDVGAAFAVCIDGQTAVDLWGGIADPGPPTRQWQQDTLQLIFSGTKGLVATCMLMLIDRGQISLDDPACRHWPEFAAHGKQDVTVADLLAHQARLPGVDTPLQERDLTDGKHVAELLAMQAQSADPRARNTYHALTYGWLCGELLRRVDGRSIGQFFAQEIAAPLALEIWIGLPAQMEPRVSTLLHSHEWNAGPDSFDNEDFAADALLTSVLGNPPILAAAEPMTWNTRAFHAAEIPGANAIGTARSIARLYSCLARGGELDSVRLMSPETVALGRRELSRFIEAFSGEPLVYGAGFQLQTERAQYYGPLDTAFGHSGAGGSVHGAWPDQRLGFSYVMNEMRPDAPDGDPRSQSLLRALFDVLASAVGSEETASRAAAT
jgi:CubicO group peptidase (beta-lactamase class C family)